MENILKKIPKINEKLDLKFRNFNDKLLQSKEMRFNFNNEIDSKINDYLSENKDKYDKNGVIKNHLIDEALSIQGENMLLNKTNKKQPFYTINEWENSPFYHKLTFRSGTHKMLKEKWNTYVGNTIKFSENNDLDKISSSSKNLYKNSSDYFINDQTKFKISLPTSTQQRIIQHKEWLKNFKKSESNSLFHSPAFV